MKDWFLLVNSQTRFLVRKGIVDTKYGRIDLRRAKPGKSVKSSKGMEFVVLEPTTRDLFLLMKRGPQVVLPEVMGFIAGKIMPEKDWRVVEAGGGSGYATLFLSWLCHEGRVYVYEKNERHFRILKENIARLGLSNVSLRQKDVLEMREKRLDMIFLDMKNPERVVEKAFKALKPGRFLAVYSPQIEQAIDMRKEIEGNGLSMDCETHELIMRKWKVDVRGYTHPEYSALGHTGFITICRRIA